ncbi:MAG: AIPR family protein [Lutibacter sp.]|nr:AIPR family protein [Lutibacter sp.]
MNSIKYLIEKRDFNRTEYGTSSTDSFIKEFIFLLKKGNYFTQNVIESVYELDNRVNIFGFDILRAESFSEENKNAYKIVFITGDYFNLVGDCSIDLKSIKRQIQGINRLLKRIRDRSFSAGDVNKLEELQSFVLNNNVVEFDIVYITDAVIKAQQNKLAELNVNYGDFSNLLFFDIKTVDSILNEDGFSKIVMSGDMFDEPKSCAHLESDKLTVYATYFTGNELFGLYRMYNRRLYDNNVRLFLDTKRKGNAAMVKTILDNPELFVSYNNGLSIVAESVNLTGNVIEGINSLSVVNGGQTLATLYYTGKKYGIESLSKVRVIAKISCLKVHEGSMVSNISRASNTQTAIKSSDFSSNLDEFILFQRFTLWYNLPYAQGFQYAFFERIQGERNDLINRAPDNKTKIEYIKKYPSSFSFVKTELSRVSHLINGNISMASNSAEKQFEVFIDNRIGLLSYLILENYLEVLSGIMLFNKFRLYCGKKGSKKFPPIGEPSAGMTISIYACGMFLKLHRSELNYLSLFQQKSVDLDNIIFDYLKESWRVLEILGGAMLQEKAKKSEFEGEFVRIFQIRNRLQLPRRIAATDTSKDEIDKIINEFKIDMK